MYVEEMGAHVKPLKVSSMIHCPEEVCMGSIPVNHFVQMDCGDHKKNPGMAVHYAHQISEL